MIGSVQYSSTGSSITITMVDGSVWCDDANLPPDTEIRRKLAAWIAAGGVVEPWQAPPPAPPASFTRRQCAAEAFARGLVDGPEMVAWAARAEPPAAVEAILAAMPEPDRWFARADLAAATYETANPTFLAIVRALLPEATDDDIAGFARAAAAR